MSELSVGEVAKRTGVSVSALHFYERKNLIKPKRTASNHRVYPRNIIRRVTVIQIAQRAGLSLAEIARALDTLPDDRAISAKDWARVSTVWRDDLTARIALLTSLRDELTGCIGCGCLSVDECPLANAGDRLSELGSGPHLLGAAGSKS
ncbi:redox-sensitive transcriptional activator SoxR [Roseibacterium beibuensis]|uniref:Redox-sensitive transcriptional activator SoxR n=1 Tax=[Roseibacterium] beibuensis TaxID=1193142 RepID=A0ABP9LQC2_9RHOB|nr:redox-sensitive transcriptional activator SoxR [Roseibacterium beibuensis]MCS6626854.1 redox-sensitive transcriptional activator SoxR [Roseibacterium beibuensis]